MFKSILATVLGLSMAAPAMAQVSTQYQVYSGKAQVRVGVRVKDKKKIAGDLIGSATFIGTIPALIDLGSNNHKYKVLPMNADVKITVLPHTQNQSGVLVTLNSKECAGATMKFLGISNGNSRDLTLYHLDEAKNQYDSSKPLGDLVLADVATFSLRNDLYDSDSFRPNQFGNAKCALTLLGGDSLTVPLAGSQAQNTPDESTQPAQLPPRAAR